MSNTETDVIVVGGGGAGLAAAIEAAGAGGRVILLEKNPALGGSTAWSVGSFSATRTPHQKRAGIEDNPDDHYEDMETLAGSYANRDNREFRRMLVDHTTETLAWLEESGLVFVGPNEEPPHRRPRMHNVLPGSKAIPYHLGRRARRAGVDIRLNTRVDHLIVQSGRVTGVQTQTGPLHARGGVVLAAGDYSASRELKTEFASPEVATLEPVNPTATGDGFRLALAIGAEMVNGDIVRGPIMRFVPPRPAAAHRPPPALAPARAGHEMVLRPHTRRTAPPLHPQLPHHRAWPVHRIVPPGRHPGQRTWPALRRRDQQTWFRRPATAGPQSLHPARRPLGRPIRGLAQLHLHRTRHLLRLPRGLPPQPPRHPRHRQHPGRAGPRHGHRPPPPSPKPSPNTTPKPAKTAPALSQRWTKAPTSPWARSAAMSSSPMAGCVSSNRFEVLDGAGHPIPGLYAAGSNGQGGVLLEGHGHHLGWAFMSGRMAGANAAASRGSATP